MTDECSLEVASPGRPAPALSLVLSVSPVLSAKPRRVLPRRVCSEWLQANDEKRKNREDATLDVRGDQRIMAQGMRTMVVDARSGDGDGGIVMRPGTGES